VETKSKFSNLGDFIGARKKNPPKGNMTNYFWDKMQIKFFFLLIFVLEHDVEKENKLFSLFYKSEKSRTTIEWFTGF
jgi:hypothetical protein